MQNSWRKRKNWDWAKRWASLFETILPREVCEVALATCRITLQGPNSVGKSKKNWGEWIRMRMQTFGNVPDGIETIQKNHHWIGTDSHQAANVILACFGLSLDDVFDQYGEPLEGETREFDLCDIVTQCDAEFALHNVDVVAVA